MSEPNTLLAVFAHPDDESLVAGGTLAKYAAAPDAESRRTALLCATRGDWGPISDDDLADYSNLGEVRERELRAACEVLGIGWLRFLDIEDGCVSAVIGSDEETATLEKIVRAIRELRPQTVITFGPDGLYGHPDHVAIGQLTVQACKLAADAEAFPQHRAEKLFAHRTDKLLFATAPQGLYSDLLAQLPPSAHLWGIPPEKFGVPAEEISLTENIAMFWERKLRALRCHRTQLDADHAFRLLTPELAGKFFSAEYFYFPA